MEQSTQAMEKTQLNLNTFQFMIDLKGVVNIQRKKKLKGQGYLQGVIIIETLKKKKKENDYSISGKKRKQPMILLKKKSFHLFFRLIFLISF